MEKQKTESEICDIVVLPTLDDSTNASKNDLHECLREVIDTVKSKTKDCHQIIKDTSVVSFTANLIQSRIISTKLGTTFEKLYNCLRVQKIEDFEEKIKQLLINGNEETVNLINELKQSFQEWENFLIDIDKQLDVIVGPEKAPDLDSSGDIHLFSQNKMFRNGTLLSYLKKSAFDLMFLEIVASFSVQECFEHVKTVFENLPEFHKLNCDILLLTKRQTQGGGGFLKLVGIPFRILLNEKESFEQLLMHRQSVVTLAGLRAIHLYSELLCSEHEVGDIDITKKELTAGMDLESSSNIRLILGNQSGCALVNRQGEILYCHVSKNDADWPDINTLLQQAKNNQPDNKKELKTDSEPLDQSSKSKDNKVGFVLTSNTSLNNTASPSEASDQTITVYKRKCCTIL